MDPDVAYEESRAEVMELIAWAPAWGFTAAEVVHALRAGVPFGATETVALSAAVAITLHAVAAVARHLRLQPAKAPPAPRAAAYR